jgi:hypothetical protein
MIRAYHFVGNTLRDGSPIPKNGEWLRVKGEIKICSSGLHASRHVADALQFAPGATLCLVDMSRDIEGQDDKLVARCRRIVARFDATELLRADARASAVSVLKNWKGAVPQIVMDWLITGDEQYRSAALSAAESEALSTARSAGWNAAESAAWHAFQSAAESVFQSAALSAAWSAARSAAWSATESAAWNAARSAAESAAWNAARSAAESAAWNAFAKLLS